MGNQARVVKDRICRTCKRVLSTDSWGLKNHVEVCKIATRAGLVLPGQIDRPGKIIKPDWS